jgi:DNA-directed RNA polymerase alpha subunit
MTVSAQHAQAAFKGLLGEEVAARCALYDRPVTDLELPRRALNVIRNEGWTKIGSIATASFNLAGIPNCGEKTKAEIEGELKRIGLGLYEPALGWQP